MRLFVAAMLLASLESIEVAFSPNDVRDWTRCYLP